MRPKKIKVEFIESYWTGGDLGSDYQWNDNHGELIRCKDCGHGEKSTDFFGKPCIKCYNPENIMTGVAHPSDWFCADAIRR